MSEPTRLERIWMNTDDMEPTIRAPVNQDSTQHPHQPEIPPALDAEGRCEVCRLTAALAAAEEQLNTLRTNATQSGLYWQERALKAEAAIVTTADLMETEQRLAAVEAERDEWKEVAEELGDELDMAEHLVRIIAGRESEFALTDNNGDNEISRALARILADTPKEGDGDTERTHNIFETERWPGPEVAEREGWSYDPQIHRWIPALTKEHATGAARGADVPDHLQRLLDASRVCNQTDTASDGDGEPE